MPKEHLFWYSKNLTGIKIGSLDVFSDGRSTSYNYGTTYQYPAIYDTGTSLIYVPESIAYELMYRLAASKTHYIYEKFMVVNCGERDQFEDVHLLINGTWFEVLAKDYIVETDGLCVLAFTINVGQEYWLLGDAFLMGYYTIHDNQDHAKA